MPPKQKYTDPKLRDEVKEDIKQSDKGGEPGQWSARKAQMMAKEYKNRGGDYNTSKSSRDESQKNLSKWGEEDWQTKDGEGEAKKEDGSRRRYLPKKAWEQMSEGEKEETDKKKQEESKKGKQFVGNTGKAKEARKDVQNDNEDENDNDQNGNSDDSNNETKTPKRKGRQSKSPAANKRKQQQNGKKSPATSRIQNGKNTQKDESASEDGSQSDTSQSSDQKENESPSRGQKRTRQQNDDKQTPDQKKQKTTTSSKSSSNNKTIGSNHDPSTPPAKQGSTSRLPKKGQKNVHWKAMPGWVEGEVMEIVEKDKEVDGKNVKASKKEPKVVLKSKSSGKVCVHRADNVYFD